MKRIPPALILYFLAPIIGELLSGSAPPTEFFNPFGLIILPALYGSGALLVREFALGWGKRWPTILTLGLAYGIVEEGLMVKSFFDPHWMDLGLLGVYGRWAGVNWVWSISLMIYHASISIAIPILLVELLYPEKRDQPWLGRRGRIGLSILLVLVVLFGFLALTTYRPPFLLYSLTLLMTTGIIWVARQLPRHFTWAVTNQSWKPIGISLLGFFSTVAFFLCMWALPSLEMHPVVTILILCAGSYLVLRLAWHAAGGGGWDDRGRFALVSGALSFFILLAPLSENDPSRLDNPAGMTLVALITVICLLLLRRRINRDMRLLNKAT